MILEVVDLHSGYGKVEVLRGVSIKVDYNETVCILGANGAGKTTLINTLSGLVEVSRGRIIFDGMDITNLSAHERVKLGLIQVPEGRKIFPKLTVMENLEIGSFVIDDIQYKKDTLGFVFSTFPILYERRFQKAGTLSGGEQQMLSISRALMSRPKLLMLDEPSMGLAVKVVNIIFKTIEILSKTMAILIVEQNANKAIYVSNRGYVMEVGRIIFSGTKSDLVGSEEMRRAYLGG